jgi:hypothetical protein
MTTLQPGSPDRQSSMDLSLQQKFELERQLRVIGEERDIEKLRGLCKQLAQAWHAQKAATMYFMKKTLANAQPNPIDLRGTPGSSPSSDRDACGL